MSSGQVAGLETVTGEAAAAAAVGGDGHEGEGEGGDEIWEEGKIPLPRSISICKEWRERENSCGEQVEEHLLAKICVQNGLLQ